MNRSIRFLSMAAITIVSLNLAAQPSIDTDRDGFPDYLETAAGYDPLVNEALQKSIRGSTCGSVMEDPSKLTKPETMLIILDISGSMSSPLADGTERMAAAKTILAKYVDSLPSSMLTAFAIYGKDNCGEDSIELLVPMGTGNKDSIKSKLSGLSPTGATPIAATLDRSVEFFKGYEEYNNNLILISDGEESCGGNPVESIRNLKATPAKPKVSVIGLGVDPQTRKQLSAIAAAADGVYSDVTTTEDMIKALTAFFAQLSGFYRDIVCIQRQYNVYLAAETEQFNKSNSRMITLKMKELDESKRAVYEEDERQIRRNHDERVAAKDKIAAMIQNKMRDMAEATARFLGTDKKKGK